MKLGILIVAGLFAGVGILCCILSLILDIYNYNNGICRKCGEPLEFDNGWEHGSTYKCKNGHVYDFETIA